MMYWKNIEKISPLIYHDELNQHLSEFVKKVFDRAGISDQKEMFIDPDSLKAVGECSTSMYLDCPNLPEHHIENYQDFEDPAEYLDEIGKYYWFDFDAIWTDQEPLELRMLFNTGDADCNDGLWGAVWERNTGELIANILSTDDWVGTIEVISGVLANRYESHKMEIPIDVCSYEDNAAGYPSIKYANDLNLEKIIGLALQMCSRPRRILL